MQSWRIKGGARRLFNCVKSEQGSIVLEASLLLPMFAAFLIAFISLVQISVTELALQDAVSETAKQIAANLYPVKLLYAEAKQKYGQSKLAAGIGEMVDKVNSAREQAEGVENFVEDYAAFIPDPVVRLMQAEKEMRETLEQTAGDSYDQAKREALRILAEKAFTPIVGLSADKRWIKSDRLKVTSIDVPIPDDAGKAFIGIEARYELKLAIPFFPKTFVLKKKAYERAWVGA
jgi:hypothetical protein